MMRCEAYTFVVHSVLKYLFVVKVLYYYYVIVCFYRFSAFVLFPA